MKVFKILFIIACIILPNLSFGELISLGRNIYSTGDEQANIDINSGEKFFISSASHLAGEIKIIADLLTVL